MKFRYNIIYVPNVLSCIDFFVRAFDFEKAMVDESGEYAELKSGETKLAFASTRFINEHIGKFISVDKSKEPLGFEIGLTTEDVEASYQKALAAGALSFKKPELMPWGQMISYVRSPEGILIEICTEIK